MRKLIDKLLNQGKDESSAEDNSNELVEEETLTSAEITDKEVDDTSQQTPGETLSTTQESSDLNTLVGSEVLVNESSDSGIGTNDVESDENPIESTAVATKETQDAITATAISSRPIDFSDTTRPSPLLQAAHCCHIGNVRSRNEDSTFLFTAEAGGQEPLLPFGFYVVADGMGGHHAGDEASRVVSRTVAQHVLERIYLPLLKKSTSTPSQPQEPIQDVVLEAIQTANRQIHSPDPGLESGTTLTTALVFGRRLYITQVGDSRAYLLNDGKLKQITKDHSYVQRLVDAGDLTEEEAAVHPQRNMLYKAVGQGGTLEIDTFTRSLPKDGTLLLCSDGLWGLVPDNLMKRIVQKEVSLWDRACELVEMALEAGGHDNISAILVTFGF